jgi:hypothetical protein
MATIKNFKSRVFNLKKTNYFKLNENSDNNIFHSNFSDCSYYFPSQLNGFLLKNDHKKNNNQIFILHLNIRSLNSNFENF